ncbi:MAG: ribonuclease HI family protein [Anaerolineae bacterium]|nr:ribonuclease HI family protein [Anaerolineae bacterium]MCX8068702.1 ribonuclease HI family protein [Anaerolineae bacterium]MDW7991229.1 ribonuclease HI family protein [Anaerolineae bacterium]
MSLKKRPVIRLLFDGGSRGNPGPGYGTYRVDLPEGNFFYDSLEFGRRMTNNEAEYQTLLTALDTLIPLLRNTGKDPRNYKLEVMGDSALVLSQVSGAWKARKERMRHLRDQVRERLSQFGEYELIRVPRSLSVRYLGH